MRCQVGQLLDQAVEHPVAVRRPGEKIVDENQVAGADRRAGRERRHRRVALAGPFDRLAAFDLGEIFDRHLAAVDLEDEVLGAEAAHPGAFFLDHHLDVDHPHVDHLGNGRIEHRGLGGDGGGEARESQQADNQTAWRLGLLLVVHG
jgi:hypothetical protein